MAVDWSHGPNIDATYRQLTAYVTKLLRGTPPGDSPIQQPRLLKFVINKQAADMIGAALPQSLLALADKVIQLKTADFRSWHLET